MAEMEYIEGVATYSGAKVWLAAMGFAPISALASQLASKSQAPYYVARAQTLCLKESKLLRQ